MTETSLSAEQQREALDLIDALVKPMMTAMVCEVIEACEVAGVQTVIMTAAVQTECILMAAYMSRSAEGTVDSFIEACRKAREHVQETTPSKQEFLDSMKARH